VKVSLKIVLSSYLIANYLLFFANFIVFSNCEILLHGYNLNLLYYIIWTYGVSNFTVDVDSTENDIVAENVNVVDENENVGNVIDIYISVDIFNRRNWGSLESKMIELVATKGPKRDFTIVKGRKDKSSRRFYG